MNGLDGWMKFVLCVLIGGFSARFIFSKYSRILSYKLFKVRRMKYVTWKSNEPVQVLRDVFLDLYLAFSSKLLQSAHKKSDITLIIRETQLKIRS